MLKTKEWGVEPAVLFILLFIYNPNQVLSYKPFYVLTILCTVSVGSFCALKYFLNHRSMINLQQTTRTILIVFSFLFLLSACKKDKDTTEPNPPDNGDNKTTKSESVVLYPLRLMQ